MVAPPHEQTFAQHYWSSTFHYSLPYPISVNHQARWRQISIFKSLLCLRQYSSNNMAYSTGYGQSCDSTSSLGSKNESLVRNFYYLFKVALILDMLSCSYTLTCTVNTSPAPSQSLAVMMGV